MSRSLAGLIAGSAARNAELAARGGFDVDVVSLVGGTNPGSPPCNRPQRQYPRVHLCRVRDMWLVSRASAPSSGGS